MALVATTALALGACAPQPRPATPASNQASDVVKVMLEGGHGSGVHIGDGYILTAAHVVGANKEVTLKSSMGDVQKGAVLWANTDYDVALVRAERPARLGSATLSCRTAAVGEVVEARGNPLMVEFVSAYGHVAGEPRAVGAWKYVLVTDSTTVPGMSGGPVYDKAGDVVGITVGVMAVPMGFGASLTGFGTVVPSSTVCMLMGRA
jgi:S1-C subfamily serine protease